MKRFLRELLAALGLVSARRHLTALRQIEELKKGSLAWKGRAAKAESRAQELEARLRDQVKSAEKLQHAMDKWRARQDHVQQLRTQLASTEQELMVARDQLMAIEVKLDILEGAANVLDSRTRLAVSGQGSGSGTSL